VLTVHPNGTGVGIEQSHNGLQQHRLADTGVPDDRQRLAFAHREGDVVEDDAGAERLANVVQLDAHRSTTAQNASSTRISMLLMTTACVVERPTAAAPPSVWKP